jgi:hypothetical protein
MHPYRQRWSDDPETWIPPQLGEFRFTNPLDVVADAELDPVLRWRIDPEIWHLDARGRLCCGTHASSLDSVRTFADDLDASLEPADGARLAVPQPVAAADPHCKSLC